jgi:mannonate dehydratase
MNQHPRLGFGLYRHMLTPENYQFARQAGATDVVVHLVDYTGQLRSPGGPQEHDQPVSDTSGWGSTDGDRSVWTVDYLRTLKSDLERQGLYLHAIENFDPAHWYDVLLGGPRRDEQIQWLCEIIENLGAVGIPTMGYNFSIAGVASRVQGPFARGGARSVGVNGIDNTPIPEGMVWNMTYRDLAPGAAIPPATHEELWDRLQYFLERVLPVAERAGVVLAAHPDDPPAGFVRGQPRLVYQPDLYYRLFDLVDSPASKAEFCLGSLQEMAGGDIYSLTEDLARRDRIGYVHFRNVVGKVPNYHEVFVDEGEVDLRRIMRILRANGYSGVVIPDHTPQMTCDAPWHSGMAFAMGYMSALIGDGQV